MRCLKPILLDTPLGIPWLKRCQLCILSGLFFVWDVLGAYMHYTVLYIYHTLYILYTVHGQFLFGNLNEQFSVLSEHNCLFFYSYFMGWGGYFDHFIFVAFICQGSHVSRLCDRELDVSQPQNKSWDWVWTMTGSWLLLKWSFFLVAWGGWWL